MKQGQNAWFALFESTYHKTTSRITLKFQYFDWPIKTMRAIDFEPLKGNYLAGLVGAGALH